MADIWDDFKRLIKQEVNTEKELVCIARNNDCFDCPYETYCAAEDIENDDCWGW